MAVTTPRRANWQAWHTAVHLPAPYASSVELVLVRNYADSSYRRNLLVVNQVVEQLGGSVGGVTKAAFAYKVKQLARAKIVQASDPLLMRQLKSMGAIGQRAPSVLLCSPATMAAVIELMPSIKSVASVIKPLAHQARRRTMSLLTLNAGGQPNAQSVEQGAALARRAAAAAAPVQATPPARPGIPIVAAAAVASGSGSVEPVADAEDGRRLGVQPISKADLFYPTHMPFPTNLPEPPVDERERAAMEAAAALNVAHRGCRYGLMQMFHCGQKDLTFARLPDAVPLKHELPGLLEWLTAPIQLNRPFGPVKTATLEDTVKVVSKYAGFAHKYMGVHLEDLSMHLLSNQECLFSFFAFVWARTKSKVKMNNDLYKVTHMLVWLRLQPDVNIDPDRVEHLERVSKHVNDLIKNLSSAFPFGKLAPDDAPRRSTARSMAASAAGPGGGGAYGGPPVQAAPLPGKHDVLRWQVHLKDKALAIIAALQHADTAATQEEASIIADWCLAEWLCNNLPPVRASCLRNVQRTALPSQPHVCTHPDCKRGAACKGNRLEILPHVWYEAEAGSVSMRPTPPEVRAWARLPGTTIPPIAPPASVGAADSSAADFSGDSEVRLPAAGLPLMRIVLPHHKMEGKWGNAALEMALPYDLAMATHFYLQHAWPVINLRSSHNLLFMRASGMPMLEPTHLCAVWAHVQAAHGAPWQPFPPTAFRTIHVEERVHELSALIGGAGGGQLQAAASTVLGGDALVMQNHVGSVWQQSYCKGGLYYNAMAQGSIDRITIWRHANVRAIHEAADDAAAEAALGDLVGGGGDADPAALDLDMEQDGAAEGDDADMAEAIEVSSSGARSAEEGGGDDGVSAGGGAAAAEGSARQRRFMQWGDEEEEDD
jgi:hypothetical protein